MKTFVAGMVVGAALIVAGVMAMYWPEIMGEDFVQRYRKGMG